MSKSRRESSTSFPRTGFPDDFQDENLDHNSYHDKGNDFNMMIAVYVKYENYKEMRSRKFWWKFCWHLTVSYGVGLSCQTGLWESLIWNGKDDQQDHDIENLT